MKFFVCAEGYKCNDGMKLWLICEYLNPSMPLKFTVFWCFTI